MINAIEDKPAVFDQFNLAMTTLGWLVVLVFATILVTWAALFIADWWSARKEYAKRLDGDRIAP